MPRNACCSYCGHRFPEGAPWPRVCAACKETSFVNPLPVAVVVLPVGDGVLAIRRAIPPHRGALALPGGFINLGETWQEAAARELLEETGIRVAVGDIEDLRTLSGPEHLLVFGKAPPLAELPALAPNEEVSEMVVLRAPTPLAFPTHTQVLDEYLRRHGACCI